MAKRRWENLTDRSQIAYSEQSITPAMYNYGFPLTSRTQKSDADIVRDIGRQAEKFGMSSEEAETLVFVVGHSEAWYLHRARLSAVRANRDGDTGTANKIYNYIYRPDLPSWVFWYFGNG